jgi:hypothetical protein
MLEIIAILGAASGLAGIVYLLDYFGFIRPHKVAIGSQRHPSLAPLIVVMFLTWAAVGFDYYDRHHAPTLNTVVNQTPFATTGINIQSIFGTSREPLYYSFNELGFPIHKLKEIKNKTFIGVTLPLDGYVYIGCSFTNVNFQYNGTDLTGGWVDAKKLNSISLVTTSAGLQSYLALGESLRIFPSDYCAASATPPPPLSPK